MRSCVDVKSGAADIFLGNGEMATLMRETDWASTSLGPTDKWPEALKTAVRILLTSKFDMWLGWGDDVAFLYNDAYRPTLGSKHPRSLAMPTRELWSEIWTDIKPLIRQVYEKGEATWSEALPLILERNGFPEETYHTFSYSPIFDDDGKVGGLLCAVVEETTRIIDRRRLNSLRVLASDLTSAGSRPAVLGAAQAALEANSYDIPFSATYLFSNGAATLVGTTGLVTPQSFIPETIQLGSKDDWPLGQDGAKIDLSGLMDLPKGPWSRAPRQALVVSLEGQAADAAHGAIFVALNPHLLADDDYLGYLKILGGQIAAGFTNAEVQEAAQQRARVLADAVLLRDEAEKTLRLANAQLSAEVVTRTSERDRLWALTDDMLAHADYGGNLIAVNPAWTRVLGWSEEKLLTDPYSDIIHPENVDTVIAALAEMGRTGKSTRFENRILSADGVWTPIGWTVSPELGTNYFIAVGRDLSEDKARERELANAQEALRQSQKMEAVGQLTGGIAHDFNNLLAGISGSLEIIERRLAQRRYDGLERFISGAHSSAQRAASLTQRLLAFSRRQTLDPKPTDVNRLVHGMEDLIGRTVGPAIAVEVVGAAGLWSTRVDAAQLENALLNLAINARDAMPDGGRITIETANKWLDDRGSRERDLLPGQYISVCLSDTGTGIATEIVDRIFDPFFTTKPIGQGTGLGLSMIHGFVRQSGGQVRVYSEPGKGTTMCLYLPRYAGELDDEEQHPEGVIEPIGAGETILVIDDEPIVRMLIVEVLEEAGYSALEAGDGPSGLKILQSDARIDLLITDVGLPGGMNGRQVADAARISRPELKILFVTGYAENAVIGNGHLDRGMQVITKPFVMAELANKITELIEG
jgi:PAS domain S-box-containing protein